MDPNTPPPKVRHRRRTYVVDRHLQLSFALHLVGVMAGIALLYALALFTLPGEDALEGLTAEETKTVFLKVTVAYWLLATAILWAVGILLTHRVAGPVHVIESALARIEKGEAVTRVPLRRYDYLKNLASTVERLAARLEQERADRDRLMRDLAACLVEGDVPAAREVFTRLGPAPEEG